MATIASSTNTTLTTVAFVAKWEGMAQGDDGQPVMGAQYTDKTIQVSGTFGGATLALEGSNDGVNYHALTDTQGNTLNITSAKIKQVVEATVYVRPVVVGGDGTTNLSVHVLMKE